MAPRAERFWLPPLAALLVAAPAGAQTQAWVRHSQTPGADFGKDLERGADFDGDGAPDLLVGGGPIYSPTPHSFVLSGHSGAILLDLVGAGDHVASPGDVDGDGVPDVAGISAGSPHGPLVAWSGENGALLWSALAPGGFEDQAPQPFDACGDVDGDGSGDLVVGSFGIWQTDPPVAGTVEVRSGAGGAHIWLEKGDSLTGDTGQSVAGLGDVNGDGIPDLAYTGAAKVAGVWTSFVHIVSGDDGHEVLTIAGGDPLYSVSAYCAAAGDADADGTPDVVATFSGASPTVYSGATGAFLFDMPMAYGSLYGKAKPRGVGDIDGNGCADVAGLGPEPAGSPFGWHGLHLYGGPVGAELHVYAGDALNEQWGWAWAGAGDVDGDGRDDLAISALESLAGPVHGRVETWGSGPSVLLELNPHAASLGALETAPQTVRVTLSHAADVLALDVGGTQVALGDGLDIVGEMQAQLVLPPPPGLGRLQLSALSPAGEGNTLPFHVLETQPPVLDVAPTLYAGRRSVWRFWGGAGDMAWLLVSGGPGTAPVQGWDVLAAPEVLAIKTLDADGAGKHGAALPASVVGLTVWSQVVTEEQGHVLGASATASSVIAP